MAVEIVVEDGTNVANANSFNTVADFETFANSLGITVPADPDAKARMLLKAMVYFVYYNGRWKGEPTYTDQSLFYPREGVPNGDDYYAKDSIPAVLKQAQLYLAGYVAQGIDITPTVAAGLPVIMEKVGPLTTMYAAPADLAGASWTQPSFPVVDALLVGLLDRGFWLTTVRI